MPDICTKSRIYRKRLCKKFFSFFMFWRQCHEFWWGLLILRMTTGERKKRKKFNFPKLFKLFSLLSQFHYFFPRMLSFHFNDMRVFFSQVVNLWCKCCLIYMREYFKNSQHCCTWKCCRVSYFFNPRATLYRIEIFPFSTPTRKVKEKVFFSFISFSFILETISFHLALSSCWKCEVEKF